MSCTWKENYCESILDEMAALPNDKLTKQNKFTISFMWRHHPFPHWLHTGHVVMASSLSSKTGLQPPAPTPTLNQKRRSVKKKSGSGKLPGQYAWKQRPQMEGISSCYCGLYFCVYFCFSIIWYIKKYILFNALSFSFSCVEVDEDDAPDIDIYHCPNCEKTHGKSTSTLVH